METNVYTIAAHHWERLDKKLARLAKKCQKHGCEFFYEVEGETVEKRSFEDRSVNVLCKKIRVGGTLKCGNWEAVAQLGVTSNGNIVRKFGEHDIPEKFRNTPNVCDHCGTARDRKILYVIRNVESGEYKQVGASCLKEYSGIDLNAVAAYWEGMELVRTSANDFGEDIGTWHCVADVKSVLANACAVYDSIGYIRSCEVGFTSAVGVRELSFGSSAEHIEAFWHVSIDTDKIDSDKTKNRVADIIDYYLGLDEDNDYIHNVKTLLKNEYIAPRDVATLAYLPAGYAKHLDKVERRKELERKIGGCDYFGNVGERYKSVPIVSMRCLTSWFGEFGITYLYAIDINGASLVWRTSKEIDTENAKAITFTVKEHSVYKGMKQTQVTRCRIM